MDKEPARLDAAKSFGADLMVQPGEAAAAVAEASGGLGADVAIEAVGVPETFEEAACPARRKVGSVVMTEPTLRRLGILPSFTAAVRGSSCPQVPAPPPFPSPAPGPSAPG
ncbi:zinc-binding dehydrogenase [Amycolatopsis mediterranei]|uniref:zinc-binding dehydrogenase n=3 Tax=Amycolatopsis mediterranei TaxID=33910 RepID=UPI0008FFAF68|nr:zinc-binding dehydrogenase [Amycolatopsis mediterranei]